MAVRPPDHRLPRSASEERRRYRIAMAGEKNRPHCRVRPGSLVGCGGPGESLRRSYVSDREDPFAAIIRCTADPAKADKRTRSKWSRVMRYASA
jgi:hypothetical protein